MVLVDARHESVDDHLTPEQVAAEDAQQQDFQDMIKWLARFGLVRLLWAPAWPSMLPGSENLSPESRTTIGVLQARPQQIESALAEGQGRMESNSLLRAAAPLGDKPLVVLASAQTIDNWPILEGSATDHDRSVVKQPPDHRPGRPRCSFRAAGIGA